jgi:hypothetical protein
MRGKQSSHGIFSSRKGEISNVEFGHLKYPSKTDEKPAETVCRPVAGISEIAVHWPDMSAWVRGPEGKQGGNSRGAASLTRRSLDQLIISIARSEAVYSLGSESTV